MVNPTLLPAGSLATVNPSPSPGAPAGRFILFTDSWLHLQNYVQQALQLPFAGNDFQSTYGDFPVQQKGEIDKVLKALGNVRDLSGTFGNPHTLKQKILTDTSYLLKASAPDEIYAHIVWLANQIYNTSTTFQYTLENLSAILDPTGRSAEQRAAALREILTGKGGLQSSAQKMEALTGDLLKKLLNFENRVVTANNEIQDYFGRRSTIVDVANRLIGEYQAAIEDLQKSADDAYDKWKAYTKATVAATVGLVLLGAILAPITFGVGLVAVGAAAIAGSALGLTAKAYQTQYNNLCAQIETQKGERLKKIQLVADVNAFNTSIGLVAPALTDFKTNLQMVQGSWAEISMNLAYIVNNYSVSQLSDMNWIMQVLKIGDAQKKWKLIGQSAQEFTQNSLVSYDLGKKFGKPVSIAA